MRYIFCCLKELTLLGAKLNGGGSYSEMVDQVKLAVAVAGNEQRAKEINELVTFLTTSPYKHHVQQYPREWLAHVANGPSNTR